MVELVFSLSFFPLVEAGRVFEVGNMIVILVLVFEVVFFGGGSPLLLLVSPQYPFSALN